MIQPREMSTSGRKRASVAYVQPSPLGPTRIITIKTAGKNVSKGMGMGLARRGLNGCIVSKVRRGSTSWDAGVKPGDVLARINNQFVLTLLYQDILAFLAKAQKGDTNIILEVAQEIRHPECPFQNDLGQIVVNTPFLTDKLEARLRALDAVKPSAAVVPLTTRPRNPDEVHARDFTFVTTRLFKTLVHEKWMGAFVKRNAPGGSIVADGAAVNPFSCFQTENDHDALKRHAEIIRALVRRYKYLQVSLEESFVKILKFLNGFEEENILKLAQSTALILSMGLISTKPLLSMDIESVVSTGLARTFITQLFRTWTKVSSMNAIGTALRKTGLDQQIHIFFPQNQRTMQGIVGYFNEKTGFDALVKWYTGLQTTEVKKELCAEITQLLKEETTQDALIERVRAVQEEHSIAESEVIKLMWPAIMGAVEWNKKAELMVEQALRHVKTNLKFLARWTKSDRAQIVLMVTMQEYCFINQNFLKIYKRFALLFYKAEILGEDAILSWHNKDHSTKGKSMFLADMDEFVTWLKTAEYED